MSRSSTIAGASYRLASFAIPSFAEPITSLPDTPACSAAELKRRFQAPSEELRQAHNALAEAHDALDSKVEGIVAETFGGTIHETMLDEPLAAKLNGKADQTDLDAEISVREALATANASAHTALQTQIAAKCEAVFGSYNGNGASSQFINLGFTPKAVLVFNTMGRSYAERSLGGADYDGGLALPGKPVSDEYNSSTHQILEITEGGFTVFQNTYLTSNNYRYSVNTNTGEHYYVAFK